MSKILTSIRQVWISNFNKHTEADIPYPNYLRLQLKELCCNYYILKSCQTLCNMRQRYQISRSALMLSLHCKLRRLLLPSLCIQGNMLANIQEPVDGSGHGNICNLGPTYLVTMAHVYNWVSSTENSTSWRYACSRLAIQLRV